MTTFDGISYRKDAVYLAVVVALVLGFVFAPDLFFGKTLLSGSEDAPSLYATGGSTDTGPRRPHVIDPGAPAWQTEAWLPLEHRLIFDEHEGPFWDPYDGYGAPFAGSMLAQPFYPPTFALSIDPTPTLYNWFIIFRLFIAGWFAALFMRLFVDRYAAAATGVATCLTGYYLGYYNIAHLSVDTTLPMVLWSIELILRRQTPLRAASAVVAASIVYLGGMPESALLVMSVGCGYALIRLAFMHKDRLRALATFCGVQLAAILVGGAMLVPFVEFERLSYNDHDPSMIGGTLVGSGYDLGWSKYFATELMPLVYGFPWTPNLPEGGFSGMRGFFGCAVLLLAVIALMAFVRNRNARTVAVPFFLAVAAYCVMKRFGNPLVNWTGDLPLFSLIEFPKYLEFALGDSMAILAGFGVAAIRGRLVAKNDVIFAGGGLLLFVTCLFAWNKGLPTGPYAWYFSAAFSIGLIAVISTTVLGYFSIALQEQRTRFISTMFAIIILGEISAGYAIPQLWTLTASANSNPYAGAPFTRFLDAHVDRNEERTFGVNGAFFPDWPGAYGFADPRALNALYPAEFLPFVRAFLATAPVTSDDEFDRFTGMRPIPSASPLFQRWLRLSSIGWLIAPTPLPLFSDLTPAFSSPGAYIYRIPHSLPRLRLVHNAVVVPSEADQLTTITSSAFDVDLGAVIDRPIPALASSGAGDRVQVLSARADAITVDVQTSGTSLLIQNDTYYPGWVATVDGSPTPIVRADYLFRGIVVPGGHHIVTIEYRSKAVALGILLSSIGIGIVLALTAWGLISEWRRRARFFQTAAA